MRGALSAGRESNYLTSAAEKHLSVRELGICKINRKAKVKKARAPTVSKKASNKKNLVGDMQRVFGTKVTIAAQPEGKNILIIFLNDIEKYTSNRKN